MDVEVKNDKSQPYLKDHEVKELIKKSQEGDQDARDLIVEKKHASCLVCCPTVS